MTCPLRIPYFRDILADERTATSLSDASAQATRSQTGADVRLVANVADAWLRMVDSGQWLKIQRACSTFEVFVPHVYDVPVATLAVRDA